jgi:hypothetical protein
LCSSPNIICYGIQEDYIGGGCGTNGEGRNVYRDLVARPEDKGPFGRPCHRWDYGTKMDIKEIVSDGTALNNLAEDIEELL